MSRSEYMMATLEMIRAKYGSAEGYAMHACGLNAEDMGKIRNNLRSEIAAVL